jgi:biotin transport system substrate-specific component
MQPTAITIPSVVVDRLVRGRATANILLVVAASALIAIAAQIAIPIPFSPVPLTMQPLAVIFLGAALGSTRGAAAAALYLLQGFSGLPVFAQGAGGAAWLIGPTAGYLLSYPLAAWVAGFVSERGWGHSVVRSITGMLLALTVIYLGGWSWLAALIGPAAAFAAGVVPFVLADIVKVALGAALLPKAEAILRKTQVGD